MSTSNPFIPPPPEKPPAEVLEPDPVWDDAVSLEGPPSPSVAPPPDLAGAADWPRVGVDARPLVCVMGVHGGAGATSLARLIGDDALDVGTDWPAASGWERPLPRLPVIAVARTHVAGVDAADRLARLWAAGRMDDADLVGVVVVDDGPRLTRAQQQAARRIGRMTPHGWHLPWIERWRLEYPTLDTAPVRARRIIKQIRALSEKKRGS